MSAHTKGPWLLATSNSWRRIVTQFDTRKVCVPTKQPDGHPDLHFPNPADAHLIVAAPDLLEAAECARNVLFLLAPEVAQLGAKAENVREKLLAAIDKAKWGPL